MALAVYSGQCRMCMVGKPAPFKDLTGKPLATGDIVVMWPDGGYLDFTMSVVVEEKDDFFVMGIRSVPLDLDDDGNPTSYWRVQKVKDHSDVIPGEHWKAFGFNYREEEAA
jgi:hypothetical protein